MPAWVAYGRAAAAPRLLRWRCRRLAAALAMRLVGDIRHATAVFHKVFGQENKPGAPVTSSHSVVIERRRRLERHWRWTVCGAVTGIGNGRMAVVLYKYTYLLNLYLNGPFNRSEAAESIAC